MAYMAFDQTQTVEYILVGKDFSPIVVDFVHMESDFVPTEGYLAPKEDSVLGRLDTGLP